MDYSALFNPKVTPQDQAIPGRETEMVPNRAGGVVFSLDDWGVLSRFLILGTEGGSYYAGERELTMDAASTVMRCIQADGQRVVRTVYNTSTSGRAPKNSPALFVLSLALRYGDNVTKAAARAAIVHVARTGTHLFELVQYLRTGGGFNRRLQAGLASWYQQHEASPEDLAYQLVKYQQRHGWSHRDVLRLVKPRGHARTGAIHDLLEYATHGYVWDVEDEPADHLMLPWAFELAKHSESPKETAALIQRYALPRECVKTEHLSDPNVWSALLYAGGTTGMPVTAMIRNLGKMTSVGLLTPLSGAMNHIVDTLINPTVLAKARVHPLSILMALRTYVAGHGDKGSLSWEPVSPIIDALDAAFYLSFGNVEPTRKNWMLALDLSASMTWSNVAGMSITPREASAAMAMVTARTEPSHVVTGFTGSQSTSTSAIKDLDVSPRQRLDDVIRHIESQHAGGTDCSLPMLMAAAKQIPVDVFVIYTDNETWAGKIQPAQALERYRQKMGRDARCVVVGMTSTGFTIADPKDKGMLDVVGFDTAAPALIASFAKGEF
jgi:60 kDa SS-A/Ro ribonucleoprotein